VGIPDARRLQQMHDDGHDVPGDDGCELCILGLLCDAPLTPPRLNQMKACIREITRGIDKVNVMASDARELGETGTLPNEETERLDKIAMHAITTAEPEAAVEGLNGGATGKIAEYSSKKFMESFNDAGMPPKTNGCEQMGMGGCEPAGAGGVDPPVAHRALTEIQAIDIIRKMYEGKLKKMPALNFNDFDADGDGTIDLAEFEGKLR